MVVHRYMTDPPSAWSENMRLVGPEVDQMLEEENKQQWQSFKQ